MSTHDRSSRDMEITQTIPHGKTGNKAVYLAHRDWVPNTAWMQYAMTFITKMNTFCDLKTVLYAAL